MVETLTDNTNRTVSEVRYVFNKYGGSMGASNSVAYMFNRNGLVTVLKEKAEEDQLMEAALEGGADDIRDEGDIFEIVTDPSDLEPVRAAIEEAGIEAESAEMAWLPQTTVALDEKGAASMVRILDAFDEIDDVQNVWHNAEFPDNFEAE